MLSDAIESLGAQDYTVTRTAVGTRTKGRYTPGATSSFTIRALITPISGREIETLPEGKLASEVRNVLTTTQLKTWDPTTGVGDVITYDGESWEVIDPQGPWLVGNSSHYHVLIARQKAL